MMRFGRRGQADRSTASSQDLASAGEAAATECHPFTGRLMDGSEAAAWLTAGVSGFAGNVSLCSAYLRAQALETLLAGRAPGLRGRVLVRWRLSDLLQGASDLQAFQVAQRAGLELLIRLDFHGKVFCVPGLGVLVGSANATLSGLGLRSQSNEEVCTLVPSSPENVAHIERLFMGAVVVDEQLFAEISEAVQAASEVDGAPVSDEWPAALLKKLQWLPAVDHLLASECLWSAPVPGLGASIDLLNVHDRELLGISQSTVPLSEVAHKLQQTKIFRWLTQSLERAGGQQFFGALTDALHRSLLDDPMPYRFEVKALLQYLIAWCEAVPALGVVVDRPQHSQRVRLLHPSPLAVEATGITTTPSDIQHQRLGSQSRSARHGRYHGRRS